MKSLKTINLKNGNTTQKKEELKSYFINSFEIFESLFDVLANNDVFYERPEKRRHQLIFYFGHTAVFYINKLILGGFLKDRINPYFESIFAIGVDEMAWDDLNNNHFAWPKVDEVREYRAKVKDTVLNFIENCEFEMPIDWQSAMWVIMMGCEHERIHIETSSVLHRQLDISKTKESNFFIFCDNFGTSPQNQLLEVPEGVVNLGKSKNDDFYGWDNEYGTYSITLPAFKASKYLVSNGEFLEFVKDGGYLKDEYWSEEGRLWKNYENISMPPFWINDNGVLYYRFLNKISILPLNFPVDVNALEAEAFCNWKSKNSNKNITLPTEAMWHRLADYTNAFQQSSNTNLDYFASSVEIDRFEHGDFFDVIGNVWQWTKTPIDAFEGFEVHPLYDDFSTPTFDGRHALIKGGSWISTGNELLKESRYAFRRHFYQHAGFRYYEVEGDLFEEFEYVEKDQEIIADIQSQYGKNSQVYDEISRKLLQFIEPQKIQKGLVLGCGVGRIGFELAKSAKRVFAIDFSARFIRAADHLKKDKGIKFQDEILTLEDLKLDNVDVTRLEFWQGDACNLKPTFCDFDFVIAHDLLTDLYDFEKFNKEFYTKITLNSFAIFSFHKNLEQRLPSNFKVYDSFEVDDYLFLVTQRV